MDRKDLVMNNMRLREDHLKCIHVNKGVLTGHQDGGGSLAFLGNKRNSVPI